MPQTFQVLRCYKCAVFQVHQTKKDNKWQCKLCGEKQSIKRFYGLGTGKECRLHVQNLNGIRGALDHTTSNSIDSDECNGTPEALDPSKTTFHKITTKSKWSEFVDKENEEEHNLIETVHKTEVVLELPKKRPCKSRITKTGLFSDKVKQSLSPNFLHNCDKDELVCSIQCNEIATNLCTPLEQLTKPEVPSKNITTPAASTQNSKWAEFIEDPQTSYSEDVITISQNKTQNESKPLFSLSDDDNLDALLEF